MPMYDYCCPCCDFEIRDQLRTVRESESMEAECPRHGRQNFVLIVRAPMVEEWAAGRYFENLSPRGETFYDRRSYRDYLKRHGLAEWSPRRGMPGQEV